MLRFLSKRFGHCLLILLGASDMLRVQAFVSRNHHQISNSNTQRRCTVSFTLAPRPFSLRPHHLALSNPPDAAVPQNYTSSSPSNASDKDDEDDKNNHEESSLSTQQQPQPTNDPTPLPKPTMPTTTTAKTCILLNTNARSVTPRVVKTAKRVLGESHVFVTETAAQAQEAAAEILARGYQLVIPVGGDGTLSSLVNMLCAHKIRQHDNTLTLEQAMAQIPTMAYIPLGTGNGVGSVVGNSVNKRKWGIFPSRKRRQQQLEITLQGLQRLGEQFAAGQEIRYDHEDYERIDVPMMEVTTYHSEKDDSDKAPPQHGDLCFFAGVGFDSLMLNDFKRIKAWSIRTGFLTRTLSSVAGYCVALVVRTLPQTVWQGRHNIHVQVTTPHVNSTLWVDHRRGDVVRPVSDALLYDGITGILAAGTSPFYGGGLRLFPFARLTVDQMHLRVGRIHPLTGFFNMPQIFAGTYRDKSDRLGCLDFIGDEFQVQVEPASNVAQRNEMPLPDTENTTAEYDTSKGYPFQHSGESVGHVERFRLRVVKEPVRFVCLKKKN